MEEKVSIIDKWNDLDNLIKSGILTLIVLVIGAIAIVAFVCFPIIFLGTAIIVTLVLAIWSSIYCKLEEIYKQF